MAAWHRFAKLYLKKHKASGTVLWTDKTKVERFGYNALGCVVLKLWLTLEAGSQLYPNSVQEWTLICDSSL